MKKSGIILTLTALMLMVSCGDLWIVKRKYNRGYFIDLHHKEKVKVADQKRKLRLEHRALTRNLQPNGLNRDVVFTESFNQAPEAIASNPYTHISPNYRVPERSTDHKEHVTKNPSYTQEKEFQSVVHLAQKPAAAKGKTASNKTRVSWKSIGIRMWLSGLSFLLLLHLVLQRVLHRWTSKTRSWAAQNQRIARFLIGGLTTTSAFLGLYTGNLLHAAGFEIGPEMIYLGYGVGAGTVAASFLKTSRSWKRRWLWPMMLLSGSALSVPAGYYNAQKAPDANVIQALVQSTKSYSTELYQSPKHALNPATTHQIWSKDMQRSNEEPVNNPGMTVGKAFAIIFFVSVLFLFLQYLIFGFSCNLACSGYELAANVLFFGGSALNIGALVYTIKKVSQKRLETKQWEQKQTQTAAD